MTTKPQLERRYFDRELSWLEFDKRVFSLAEKSSTPPLERLKYAAITASNLAEFFMVRVASLEQQLRAEAGPARRSCLTPAETLARARRMVLNLDGRIQRQLADELLPTLATRGLNVVTADSLDAEQQEEVERIFWHDVLHLLNPTPFHPDWSFPGIPSQTIGIAARLRRRGVERLAYVRVPRGFGARFVSLGTGSNTFIGAEEILRTHVADIFPDWTIVEHVMFRVLRDADVGYNDLDDHDQARALEEGLRLRRHRQVVRVEVLGPGIPHSMWQSFRKMFSITRRHVYPVNHMLAVDGLMPLVSLPGMSELRDEPWAPPTHRAFEPGSPEQVFTRVRDWPVLVQHPYDDYATTVERFVSAAVNDPDVLALKHSLYRTNDDSSVVPALIAAHDRERRAVCLVEIKARFDELANIEWGRELKQAGVEVSYGTPTLKTHAKAILVVRKEGNTVRRYAHIGTGNYHSRTARLYEDIGLITADPEITADVANLFDWLADDTPRPHFKRLLVAPDGVRAGIITRIRQARDVALTERPARILMKMNSLVDEACIDALYAASQAGVDVALVVRGVCRLRPGVPGLSDNIRVISIVGRVLEHSRIYCFEHSGNAEVLIGSADLMPRNLDRRVEALVPVDAPDHVDALVQLLDRCMAESISAWELQVTGRWRKRSAAVDSPADIHLELRDWHRTRHQAASQPRAPQVRPPLPDTKELHGPP